MAEPGEPLRENEGAKFEDLARRPNPDSLVILPVPSIEDLIPASSKRLKSGSSGSRARGHAMLIGVI